MFFGRLLQPETPLSLSATDSSHSTIHITNAALSKSSIQAELYLKISEQEILVCDLTRSIGVLQYALNIVVDLKDSPALIAKNGHIHVCGHYQSFQENNQSSLRSSTEAYTATNKKNNSLESKFQKAQTIPPENLSTSINIGFGKSQQKNKPETTEQVANSRQSSRLSSRLSSRRSDTPNPQPKNPSPKADEEKRQKSQKNNKKQEKKSSKDSTVLSNGRYNLKALLQNIDDDDSDEGSEAVFDDDDEEDDDGDSDDDEELEEDQDSSEEEKKPKKKVKIAKESIDQQKNEKKQQSHRVKSEGKPPIQIVQEESSDKPEANTEQFQQKWPENTEDHHQNSKAQQKMQELASKLKVPTKRPTI